MALLGLIPFLAWAALVAALAAAPRSGHAAVRAWREACILAALLWGGWLALGTELLGLGRWLTLGPVLAWWAAPTVAAGALAIHRARRHPATFAPLVSARSWRPPAPLITLPTAALLLLLGAIAALTPPNNWDANVYHLPRQVFWMQQASVDHYPTAELRQLVMPPLAEFAGLHLMILSGGEPWANLVQWFALVVAALAASLIAHELGAPPRAQALAALVLVAYPPATMQAVNAKNDLVVAAWTAGAAWLALAAWNRRRLGPATAALLGLALGLMALTKATGAILALPLGAAIAAVLVTLHGRRAWRSAAVIGAIALALNAPHAARNIADFGSPTGLPDRRGGWGVFNEVFTPAAIVSNIVRNLAVHAGAPHHGWNRAVERAVLVLHESMGLDPEDPRTTYRSERFDIRWRPYHENTTPAPVHLLLGLVVVPALLWWRRPARQALALAAIVYGSFLVFCIVLKWQPWHGRLLIPNIALMAPLAATLVGSSARGPAAGVLAAAAIALATPPLLWSKYKPLLGAPGLLEATWEQNMVRHNPALAEPLREVAVLIADLRPGTVAVLRSGDAWQYLLQRALMRATDPPPRFVAFTDHPLRRGHRALDPPDLAVGMSNDAYLIPHPDSGATFVAVEHRGPYVVYLRADLAEAYQARRPDGPAFGGWSSDEGLAPAAGPYPEKGLPRVRWGLWPRTTLRFESDGRPTRLALEARRNPRPDQGMTISLNGRVVARHAFGKPDLFDRLHVSLHPRPGPNELVIEYAHPYGAGDGRPLAVLYRRLRLVQPGPD